MIKDVKLNQVFLGTANNDSVMKTSEASKKSTTNKHFSNCWFKVFITQHICNYIMEYNQYFALFIWIVIINNWINIIQIL